MTTDYVLRFARQPYTELDQIAGAASRDHNFGNDPPWLLTFRGGLYGMYCRLRTVASHFHHMHAWIPRPRDPWEAECEVAVCLFGMDSAIECFTFALNALGSAVAPSLFHSVQDREALRNVAPKNVHGSKPRPGYAKYFPTLQRLWIDRREVLTKICDHHDVSKHRQSILRGGACRLDPPPGFFEALEFPVDDARRVTWAPMAETILPADPRAPEVEHQPLPYGSSPRFEEIAHDFVAFVAESGAAALADARATIPLKESA